MRGHGRTKKKRDLNFVVDIICHPAILLHVMQLTQQDCENLIDALKEWDDTCSPKELDDGEVGLNADRFDDIMARLHKAAGYYHVEYNSQEK